MAKLNLVANPTFDARVGIFPAGEDAKPMYVRLTFKHRTKKAMTEWLNSRTGKSDVESFMDMVVGWDIDDLPFNQENVEVLLDNFGGTARATLDVYVDQLFKAKVGNS